MDALSRLHPTASGLLTLVDNTLARNGCRIDHPIWPLLREAGRLPGDALACAAGWLPDELDTRAALLAHQHDAEAEVAAVITASADWEGDASSAFRARLANAHEDLVLLDETGRLTHQWFTDLSTYLRQARLRLAHILGRTLQSAEAVTLKIGPVLGGIRPQAQAEAAATIGALVLTEVGLFWQGAVALSHHWTTRIEAAASTHTPHLAHLPGPTHTSTPLTAARRTTTLRADL